MGCVQGDFLRFIDMATHLEEDMIKTHYYSIIVLLMGNCFPIMLSVEV